MKKKLRRVRDVIKSDSQKIRQKIEFYYNEKFFNLFLNKYKFTGINRQQQDYIMRQFWGATGRVACYKLPMTESESTPEGVVIFTPFAPSGLYNIYNWPVEVTLINTRAVNFIPNNSLKVNEEVVLGFIQRDRKGIYSTIEEKIHQLVDIEMTIRTNLKSQKTPYLIGITPENEFKMQNLYDNLMDDDPSLFVSLEELQNAKALVSGAPYIIDKLEAQRRAVESEILTRLGVDNLGLSEKKEHFIVDEVNANNEVINDSDDIYLDCLNEFFKDVKEVLGYTITVEAKQCECKKESEKEEGEDYDE